ADRLLPEGLKLEEVHQLLGPPALPHLVTGPARGGEEGVEEVRPHVQVPAEEQVLQTRHVLEELDVLETAAHPQRGHLWRWETCEDRKSTRLNSSHVKISYAVFCLKKKNT